MADKDTSTNPQGWMKKNLFSMCLLAALLVLAVVHDSKITDLRVKVAKLEGGTQSVEAVKTDVDAVKDALIRIGVQDNVHLREQMQGEIANYVSKQRNQKKEDRVNKFELAPEKATGNVYGNDNAKIALIEYSDYDCPFCTRFHSTPKNIVDKSNGNIKWVYKHFPLDSLHPQARLQSEAAECVAKLSGNKMFWAFSDKLMNTKNAAGQMMNIATSMGIDTTKLRECMNDPSIKDLVSTHIKEGTDMGIKGTPATVVLNTETGNAILVSGAVKEADILNYIKQVL